MSAPIRLSQFLPYILPNAPGAPDIVAEKYVRLAAIEFCERTRCWRHITQIDIDEDRTVGMAAPFYAAIHEIEYATFSRGAEDKRDLIPTQYSDIAKLPDANFAREGMPRYVTQSSPNTVTIYPMTAGTLEISLFLKPRMGQDFQPGEPDDPIQDTLNLAPDFLLTQFGSAISCGALAQMLMQPQTRWHDPQKALYYQQKFNEACDRQFSHNMRGQQRAPRRTRFRFL